MTALVAERAFLARTRRGMFGSVRCLRHGRRTSCDLAARRHGERRRRTKCARRAATATIRSRSGAHSRSNCATRRAAARWRVGNDHRERRADARGREERLVAGVAPAGRDGRRSAPHDHDVLRRRRRARGDSRGRGRTACIARSSSRASAAPTTSRRAPRVVDAGRRGLQRRPDDHRRRWWRSACTYSTQGEGSADTLAHADHRGVRCWCSARGRCAKNWPRRCARRDSRSCAVACYETVGVDVQPE